MAHIAYLFSTFPALSTTFVHQQVSATLDQSLEAMLFSTRPPKPGGFHPQDEHFYNDTIYLSKISLLDYLIKIVKTLISSPVSYIKAVLLAFQLNDAFPWQRARNIIHLIGATVLTDILKKNNITHIHVHYAYGAAGVAMFSNVLSGITYSVSIHGSDVLLPCPLVEEKLKRSKFIVSNCDFHINNLRKRYFSLKYKPFYIVRGGLDLNSVAWGTSSLPIFKGKLNILHVARLEPVKAQDLIIKACADLKKKSVKFLCKIAGDGPERESLENLIREMDLSENVKLLGQCYQDEVVKLYEWSHVVVLSSLSEGTPMTVIEAMAKGRPVVVPEITALPEMVKNGENGFRFNKGSHEELASALSSFFKNPEIIETMGGNGRRFAEKSFDLKKNASLLMNILGKEIPEAFTIDFYNQIKGGA